MPYFKTIESMRTMLTGHPKNEEASAPPAPERCPIACHPNSVVTHAPALPVYADHRLALVGAVPTYVTPVLQTSTRDVPTRLLPNREMVAVRRGCSSLACEYAPLYCEHYGLPVQQWCALCRNRFLFPERCQL